MLLAIADRVELEHRPLLQALPKPLIVVDEEEEVLTEKLFVPLRDEAI